MHQLHICVDILKIWYKSVEYFWSNTCLKLNGCDIENSRFNTPDRLPLLEHKMKNFDNMNILLNLSRQLCKQQHFD